jgi:hypothetical protein
MWAYEQLLPASLDEATVRVKPFSSMDTDCFWSVAIGSAPTNPCCSQLLRIGIVKSYPGLAIPSNVTIVFQPEIWRAGAPTYKGLLRFMIQEEADSGFFG